MSACQQAKAARRKARNDERYAHKGNRDHAATDRKQARILAGIKMRQQRKAGGGLDR